MDPAGASQPGVPSAVRVNLTHSAHSAHASCNSPLARTHARTPTHTSSTHGHVPTPIMHTSPTNTQHCLGKSPCLTLRDRGIRQEEQGKRFHLPTSFSDTKQNWGRATLGASACDDAPGTLPQPSIGAACPAVRSVCHASGVRDIRPRSPCGSRSRPSAADEPATDGGPDNCSR